MKTIITTYMPSKSGSWKKEHNKSVKDTEENLKILEKKNKKVLQVRDFNCKEVN